jgi:hypothetical protein
MALQAQKASLIRKSIHLAPKWLQLTDSIYNEIPSLIKMFWGPKGAQEDSIWNLGTKSGSKRIRLKKCDHVGGRKQLAQLTGNIYVETPQQYPWGRLRMQFGNLGNKN